MTVTVDRTSDPLPPLNMPEGSRPTFQDFGLPDIPAECIRRRRFRYYTPHVRDDVAARDGNACRNCGAVPWSEPIPNDPEGRLTGLWLDRHHILAHSKGGCSHAHNLVLLCPDCHKGFSA